MKNIFKAILFFFVVGISSQANAQFQLLKIDSFGLLRDTLKFGDSVDFVYRVTNISDSDQAFNDTITTYLKTDLDSTPLKIGSGLMFIPDEGSIIISTRFAIKNTHFVNNRVTEITIWPEANGNAAFSPTFDSVKQLVMVVQVLSVNDVKNTPGYANIYPNPSKDIIHLDMANPSVSMKYITLRDLQGRNLHSYLTETGQNIVDLRNLQSGIYIMEVQYSDKTTGFYRIIKSF